MLLKTLKIRNFRNIKKLDIDFSSNGADSENAIKSRSFVKIQSGKVLPKISTLIGVNAVGKSNILESFKFFEHFALRLNYESTKELVFAKNSGNMDFSEKDWVEETKKFIKDVLAGDKEKFKEFFEHKKAYINKSYLNCANTTGEPIVLEQTFALGDKEEWLRLTLDNQSTIFETSSKQLKESFEKDPNRYGVTYFDELSLNLSFIDEQAVILEKKLWDIAGENNAKLLKLIQVADPTITSIIKKNKHMYFVSDNSAKEIPFDDLSSGTKRFLLIAEFIISSIKDSRIILLDEIEPFMHRELASSLIDLMNILSREYNDRTIIFTTHNPMIIGAQLKYRQVHEISYNPSTGEHESRKLSSIFKQHQNIEKQYKEGRICSFPSSAFAYDFIWDVANEK